MKVGKIFVVATPLGNMEDMTYRAVRILREVDLVAAEDTRRAQQLLQYWQITGKRLVSYYDPVELQRSETLLNTIEAEGCSLALISDAGTPCIADPGYRLISGARKRGIEVIPVPGASSLVSAVSVAGLPRDEFLFIGFLPTKNKALVEQVSSWAGRSRTVVYFEATRRLKRSLAVIRDIYPSSRVCICREMTKTYEEYAALDIQQALDWANQHTQLKGEVVVVWHLASTTPVSTEEFAGISLEEMVLTFFAQGGTLREGLRQFRDCGLTRQELYSFLLEKRPKHS